MPNRFLFGSDTVAPAEPAPYYSVYELYGPLWRALTPDASRKIRLGNYERIFDEGRRRVRAWERPTSSSNRHATPIVERQA